MPKYRSPLRSGSRQASPSRPSRLVASLAALVLAGAGTAARAAPAAWSQEPGWKTAAPESEPPGPPPGIAVHMPAPVTPGRAGRLVDFQGAVWLLDVAHGRWEEGLRNRALAGGDRLSTGADGRAEVRIGSTELRLGPRTELEIVELGDDRLVWRLAAGSLAWRVRRHEIARESELRAAGVRVRADGPGHFRLDVEDGFVWAGAWRGSLRVDSGDQLVQVAAGRRAEFMRPGPGPGTAITWSVPVRDAFADWVARDEVRDEQQALASAAYVSPEMTGVEDLDRHGRWERHPEFGMVWSPLVVEAGWEPFRHGRWVWHARWGWTWVDAAPWGFAPFHYGRWVRWGGRWCWVPGPYLARPTFAPALVAWYGSPGPGVTVGVTLHGRHWAPLPPRHYHPPSPWPARPLPPRVHPIPREPAYDPRRRLPDPHWRAPEPVPVPHGRPLPRDDRTHPGRLIRPGAHQEQAPLVQPATQPVLREPPRQGSRGPRDERQDPAPAAAPAVQAPAPGHARTPEAMRERPRERMVVP